MNEMNKAVEERGYITLGDLRKLDLPDETPIFTDGELATEVHAAYLSQEEIDDNLELNPEEKSSEDKPILAICFA